MRGWLRDFPVFAEALERRDLTVDHLMYLRSKLDNDRNRAALKDDQQFFADFGPDISFKDFEIVCESWIAHVDPDGDEPLDQLENSGVSINVGLGGRTKIVIDSDAVSGSAVARMIEHEARKLRKQDKADGVESTDRQRRHAATFALIERGFRREGGTHPIPLFNADSRILDYSYNARTPPEHLRTASHIEHRGQCPTPGCDAPHQWLHIDQGKSALAPQAPQRLSDAHYSTVPARVAKPDSETSNQSAKATTWPRVPPPAIYLRRTSHPLLGTGKAGIGQNVPRLPTMTTVMIDSDDQSLLSGADDSQRMHAGCRPRAATGYLAKVSSYAHRPSTDDPEQVPVRHAATVMIVANRPKLEVLMVQRTSRAVFGPSAWVFPGGRVDADDAADLAHVVHGLSDHEASSILDVPANGRAWWIAGLRETLEEAGLLLGAGDAPLDVIEKTRDAVHADAGVFVDALAAHDLSLDISKVNEVARFVTPVGPPRRFDTRFFVAAAPDGQIARHDEEEVVRHEWVEPAVAIEKSRRDEFPLMSVTHRLLACLSRYTTVDDVLQVASERRPPQRVRVNDPDGAYEVILPGEPGYETADLEIEHGWIRI